MIPKMSLECQNTQLKTEQHPGLLWYRRKCFLLPLHNPSLNTHTYLLHLQMLMQKLTSQQQSIPLHDITLRVRQHKILRINHVANNFEGCE